MCRRVLRGLIALLMLGTLMALVPSAWATPCHLLGRHCETGPVHRSLDAEQPHGMGDPNATWKRSQQTLALG
jgi:hypothetical protein